jgi:rhodanese-related sulfurtransferase
MKRIYFLTVLFIYGLANVVGAQDEAIGIKDFVAILDKAESPQILDARSPDEYALNHIKGAINVNMSDKAGLEKTVAALNPDNPAFTYSINSGRSAVLADKLRASGFKQVYVLPGGLANWVGSGYPLETFGEKGLALTNEQFNQLTRSNDMVLIDYGSKFCGGCRRLIPVLDSLENTFSETVKIVRIEMYDNPELIKEQKIQSLPTLVLFKKGESVWSHKGFVTSDILSQVIREQLKSK